MQVAFLPQVPWRWLGLMTFIACLIRCSLFWLYVQHEERYCQADTLDYHISALGIAKGTGMHRVDTLKPIFWRTPGYPWYLSLFYSYFGLTSPAFKDNLLAHKAALYVQIFLSASIPLILFFLVFLLTQSIFVSLLVGWILTVHPGFILASTYLLTEGIALIFFFMYLIFFYAAVQWWHSPEIDLKKTVFFLGLAGVFLGIYTWMRPNGEFVFFLSSLIIILSGSSLRKKFIHIVTLCIFFYATIGAWYLRNYQLTGKLFFCPMMAPYLVSFSAPKIIRRIEKQPLELCIKYALYMTTKYHEQMEEVYRVIKSPYCIPRELCCMKTATEWIFKHPFYFVYDWMKEVTKTAFDLYSSQLVALTTHCFKWDPLEEFLSEKLYAALFDPKINVLVHIIAWIELIFWMVMWVGIIGGVYFFVIRELINRSKTRQVEKKLFNLWIKINLLVGGMLFMTGGFGYARLRLPIEPLMIMCGIIFWLWIIDRKKIAWLVT